MNKNCPEHKSTKWKKKLDHVFNKLHWGQIDSCGRPKHIYSEVTFLSTLLHFPCWTKSLIDMTFNGISDHWQRKLPKGQLTSTGSLSILISGIARLKTEKVNITIKFSTFELVFVPIYS